jgi:hypothetical protein
MNLKLKQHYLIVAILTFIIFLVFRLSLAPIASGDLALTQRVSTPISLINSLSYDVPSEGYRPLNVFLSHNTAYLARTYGESVYPLIVLLPAILTALISLMIFILSLRITNNFYVSYGAAFLNFFSAVFIGGLLNSFQLFYLMPHFLNICAFLFYFLYITSCNKSSKNYFLLIAALACFISPLFREAGFIAAFTILGCEVARYAFYFLNKIKDKPSIKISSLFFILFLHSLAPKTIFYLSQIYTGSFNTLFGAERMETVNNSLSLKLHTIRFIQLLFEFPPLLWFVCLLGMAFLLSCYLSSPRKYFPVVCFDEIIKGPPTFRIKIIAATIFVGLSCLFVTSFYISDVAIWFFLTMFLIAFLTINPYLVIWVGVSSMPGLLVRNEHLYLNLFLITSLSVVFAVGTYSAYIFIKNVAHEKIRRALLSCLVVIFVISSMDFAGNYFSSYFATLHIDKKHEEIASWMRKNIPEGSLIATNFFPGRDILYKATYLKDSNQLNISKEKKSHLESYFEVRYVTNELSFPIFQNKKDQMLSELKPGLFQRMKEKKKDLYFVMIESYNTDNGIYAPYAKLKLMQTYNIHNFLLRVDPLRHLIFNKNYLLEFNKDIARLPGNATYPDYDTSYRYTFYEKNNLWSSLVKVYKLSYKDLSLINSEDFLFKTYQLPNNL